MLRDLLFIVAMFMLPALGIATYHWLVSSASHQEKVLKHDCISDGGRYIEGKCLPREPK